MQQLGRLEQQQVQLQQLLLEPLELPTTTCSPSRVLRLLLRGVAGRKAARTRDAHGDLPLHLAVEKAAPAAFGLALTWLEKEQRKWNNVSAADPVYDEVAGIAHGACVATGCADRPPELGEHFWGDRSFGR